MDRAAFDQFVETELSAVFQTLEDRRKAVAKRLILACIAAVVIAALISLAWWLYTDGVFAVIVLAVMAIMACGIIKKSLTDDYVRDFKVQVVRPIVAFISPDLTYAPNKAISLARYRASGLCPEGEFRSTGEDMIRGTVGQTRIEFSELHVERKTRPSGTRGSSEPHWTTEFQGLFFVAEFNKHFRGRTLVHPDVAEKLLGRLGRTIQIVGQDDCELVRLEDPAFEREFVVHSTDQVEARYILSPAMMQRMLEFQVRSGLPVTFSFAGGEVFIGISSLRDRFEPRLFGSAPGHDLAHEIWNDVQLALGIVEDLNLNTRIWSKT